MPAISLSSPAFFQNGIGGVSSVLGVESGCNRVVRYSFVSPAGGASAVTVSLTGLVFGGGTRPDSFRFFIGTDPNSHISAGASATCTGILSSTSATDFSGTADILLLPQRQYYLFVFPNTTAYGWFSLELAGAVLHTSGGSASVPTVSGSATLGSTLTIQTNRASSGFTHKLTYTFGGLSGTIAQDVTDRCTWTPPLELARQIPNAASGVATISCTTYQGEKQIGTPQSVQVTLQVPESLVPTVTANWTDASGAQEKLGSLVQLVSALDVQATAAGTYGSTVTGVTVTLDGKTYTGGTIDASGQLPLTVTVRDSRGRTGSAAYTLTVSPYTPPQLTLNASRCTSDGTPDDTGEFAAITLTGQTEALAGNTAALSFTCGETTQPVPVEVGAFVHSQIVPAPSTQTMSITANLSDALLSTRRSMTLSVGYATLDFLGGGRGIAFGTTATREGFECAMDACFSGQLYRLAADGQKEWFFPPMELGVEYRTAERWRGKPVYTFAMDCGHFPSTAGSVDAYHNLSATALIQVGAEIYQDMGRTLCSPYHSPNGNLFVSANEKSFLLYATGNGFQAYGARAWIKYTKT